MSQRLISVIEKGNRCILVIKDNKEFNFKLFNNEFIKNSKALYKDIAILITKKNNIVKEVYKV